MAPDAQNRLSPERVPPARPARRPSRFWLYAPFATVALLATIWTIGWFVIRGRTVDGLDTWVASEAEAGRRWTCAERSVGGYPFRIEVGCATLSVTRPDVSATLGRLVVVAQVYDPGWVIAELAGPLKLQAGSTAVEGEWTSTRASVRLERGIVERASLVVEAPSVRVAGPDIAPTTISARRLETHARPSPTLATTVEASMQADGAIIPGLDALIGGAEPADIGLRLMLLQVRDFPARPLAAEVDRWRASGGRIDVAELGIGKGQGRIEARGTLGIDEQHRPEGRFEVASAGLQGVLGRFTGGGAGLAAGLLGALTGQAQAEIRQTAPARPGAPALRPLPPIRLEGGRLYVGPLPIPGLRFGRVY